MFKRLYENILCIFFLSFVVISLKVLLHPKNDFKKRVKIQHLHLWRSWNQSYQSLQSDKLNDCLLECTSPVHSLHMSITLIELKPDSWSPTNGRDRWFDAVGEYKDLLLGLSLYFTFPIFKNVSSLFWLPQS